MLPLKVAWHTLLLHAWESDQLPSVLPSALQRAWSRTQLALAGQTRALQPQPARCPLGVSSMAQDMISAYAALSLSPQELLNELFMHCSAAQPYSWSGA